MNCVHVNEAWKLLGPTPGIKINGCKWAFKGKYNTKDLFKSKETPIFQIRKCQNYIVMWPSEIEYVYAANSSQNTL